MFAITIYVNPLILRLTPPLSNPSLVLLPSVSPLPVGIAGSVLPGKRILSMEDLFIAEGAIFRAIVDSAPDAIRVCEHRSVDRVIRLGQVRRVIGLGEQERRKVRKVPLRVHAREFSSSPADSFLGGDSKREEHHQ
jgi:hypothetical protein